MSLQFRKEMYFIIYTDSGSGSSARTYNPQSSDGVLALMNKRDSETTTMLAAHRQC